MTAITITTAGLNTLRDVLRGSGNPLVTYVAFGSSNATPTAGDRQLNAETFRKKVSSYTIGGNGEILVSMYLGAGEGVGDDIEEVGFFSGNSATGTANTGILFAHGLYSHNPKANTQSIQFQIDLTFVQN